MDIIISIIIIAILAIAWFLIPGDTFNVYFGNNEMEDPTIAIIVLVAIIVIVVIFIAKKIKNILG